MRRGVGRGRAHRLAILVIGLVAAGPLPADTIYQATPRGQEQVVQRQAIVVHQDADEIIYKHFSLPDHRVERVLLNQGSLAYSVQVSNPAERRQIVSLWKEFGYTAAVTDVSGKTTTVYDAYIDYYPPHGVGTLFQVIPPVTSFPIQLTNGGADLVSFAKVARARFPKGHLILTLRTGQVVQGAYLMPTSEAVEARFLGITDQYDPSSPAVFDFSLPLQRIRQIVFNP